MKIALIRKAYYRGLIGLRKAIEAMMIVNHALSVEDCKRILKGA